MIKNLVFLFIITVLVALPTSSTPLETVTTDWDVTFHILTYTIPGRISLTSDGKTLSGTCDTEHTGHGTISGSVKDAKLTFTAKFEKHESIDFTGTLKDGKLEGEFKTEGNTGQWTATPHKAS